MDELVCLDVVLCSVNNDYELAEEYVPVYSVCSYSLHLYGTRS